MRQAVIACSPMPVFVPYLPACRPVASPSAARPPSPPARVMRRRLPCRRRSRARYDAIRMMRAPLRAAHAMRERCARAPRTQKEMRVIFVIMRVYARAVSDTMARAGCR